MQVVSNSIEPRASNRSALASQRVKNVALGLAVALSAFADSAMAQVGGGTGTVDTTQARALSLTSGFQTMMFAIGGVVLAAAFMYVGYALAWGGKKWSDVANVCYGAGVAGAGAMLVGWIFS